MTGRTPNAADIMQANAYYLRCRDVDGTPVIITPTATGLGAHTRWFYEEDEEDEGNVMDVEEEQGNTVDMPTTPTAQRTFDAGSVIRTLSRSHSHYSAAPSALALMASTSGTIIPTGSESAYSNRLILDSA